ncbi:MAG: PIN domain-containing protein [Actinomycetales bacterium]
MFSAFLDTSVLWPSLQRDFLLSMAAEGLYRPLWSEAILEELHEHEARKLAGRGATNDEALARSEHLIDRLCSAFDDALVTGWEALEGTFGLPDPDDEHVVSAAFVGGAGVIVTDNLKHFPTENLPRHIDVQSAREFAANTVSVDPSRAAKALIEISMRHRNPKHSAKELLELLTTRYSMGEVADLVAPVLTGHE